MRVLFSCQLDTGWLLRMSSLERVHRNMRLQCSRSTFNLICAQAHTEDCFHSSFLLDVKHVLGILELRLLQIIFVTLFSHTCSLETYKVITRLFFLSLSLSFFFFAVNNSVLLPFLSPTGSPLPSILSSNRL